MRIFIVLLAVLALGIYFTPKAQCGSTTLRFTIASSASTSTPNLRIGLMGSGLVREGSTSGDKVQMFVRDTTVNYFLTKSTTVTLTGTMAAKIQVDQDTKVYKGGDTTYYMICYSGTDCYEGVR